MISAELPILDSDKQRSELADFYKVNKTRLYSIARSILKNKQDSEDAVQETFARITGSLGDFFQIPPEKRVAYASVIVKNVSKDMLKKRQSLPVVTLEDYEHEIVPDISFDEILIGDEEARKLVKFIHGMSDWLKEPLMLKLIHGKNTAEIARALNISEGAVRKRLSIARKLISEFRKGNNND